MRHISNLRLLGENTICWAHRKPSSCSLELLHAKGVKLYQDLDAALNDCSSVVIATPTDTHIVLANLAILKSRHIYIEKPISHKMFNPVDLYEHEKRFAIEVGCHLRSHPVLQKLKSDLDVEKKAIGYTFNLGHRLDLWRPNVDYKRGFSRDSLRGGGALFELVHMVDLAIWFFGPVYRVSALLTKKGYLDIDKEDFCLLTVEHVNGIAGQIQIDMVSPAYRSFIQIVSINKIFEFSIETNVLTVYSEHDGPVKYGPDPAFERNSMFLSHISHFISRTRNNQYLRPRCSVHDSIHALSILEAARKSNQSQTWITLKS
jgi:predicted dehydrogenase